MPVSQCEREREREGERAEREKTSNHQFLSVQFEVTLFFQQMRDEESQQGSEPADFLILSLGGPLASDASVLTQGKMKRPFFPSDGGNFFDTSRGDDASAAIRKLGFPF